MDDLSRAYIEGYADDPDIGRSIYAQDAFIERTTRQASSKSFSLVTAESSDGSLKGFSFGLALPAGRWWSGDSDDEPPGEVLRHSKFAVIELVVLPSFRRLGLATRLMEALLSDRAEPWATLLADKTGHAREIYDAWGWQRVGSIRPAADVPTLDVLVLPLTQHDRLRGPV